MNTKKILLVALGAIVAGLVSAGWFWSMGTPWKPGELLGTAYAFTCLAMVVGGGAVVYAIEQAAKREGE